MALTDEGNGGIPATMLVGPANIGGGMGYPYPVYQQSGNNGGFGGDNGWWVILLIIILMAAGGWGNNNGNGGGGFMNGGNGVGNLYPWMNQAEITTNGFQNQLLNDNVTSIRDGINSLSTQLCNCCCDMRETVSNGFYNAETAANARQVANMQQAFAAQTAMSQGFNALSTQFADCCCENRLANCQTQNIIQREGSETRFADANNTRDIIQSQTSGTQAILDKLCQLELDNYKAQLEAKNDTIAQLRSDVLYARGQASQDVQTARILAGQTAEVDALYDRLNNCPVGTVPVYGRQPIFTCPNNNNGCGCGCNGNF